MYIAKISSNYVTTVFLLILWFTYTNLFSGKGHYSKAVSKKARHSLFIPVTDEFKTEDC